MTDGPYKLPPGWRWVRLGEVVEHRRRSIDTRRFPDETFILYSIPNYDNGMQPEKVDGAQIGSNKLLVEAGICLFSKLNPRLPRAWIIQEANNEYRKVASTEFMPLKPRNDALDLVYLGKLLVSEVFLKQVRGDVTGATGSRQRLKPDVVLDAVIPLPPLTEQHRIVARIEELMARVREARRLREETKKDAERLMQAALAEVFPRPGTKASPGWRWVRLGEVAKTSFSGGTPSTKIEAYWDGDIPWTTSASISEDDVFLKGYLRTITQEGLKNSATKIAPSGSLIVGTRVGVGKAVVATFDVAISQDLTAFILCKDVEAVFLAYLFKSCILQAQLQTKTRGTTIKGITRKELLTALIPLPPLAEQRRIVAYLDTVQEKVNGLKEAQSATEAELKRLEQAILDKAFRGEL